MATYQVETESGVYEIETENVKPMFASKDEGMAQLNKDKATQRQAEFEASPVGFPITQGLAVVNRAINTATGNLPEIIANKIGSTTRPITESDIARSTGEAIGFVAPTGAPMRAIKAAEVIKNPLTRSVAQGAGAMATQLPTQDRGTEEYVGGVATGGALGMAGRGVEKVAEGAIQQGAKALSGRIGDFLVKLPLKAFRFSKDPIDVLSKEADGLVSNNIGQYADNADALLTVRNNQLKNAVSQSDKVVNLQDTIQSHLSGARKSSSGALVGKEAKINKLDELVESLNKRAENKDFENLSLSEAVDLKKQIADDFPFNIENSNDVIANAAHKIYHDINVALEAVEPSIAELNHRVSGLIDIKNAARNRLAVESRNNPVGMVGRLAGIGAAGIGIGAGAPVEGLITGLGIMGIEKAIQSPAVLSRVAKALSALSGEERLKVIQAYPELNKVIKVDSRDVEIIIPEKKSVGSEIAKRRPIIKMEDVKKGLPNLEPSGYKSFREKPIITPASGAGEKVINIGEKYRVINEFDKNPIVIEQGGESIPLKKKTPIPSKKSKSEDVGKLKGKKKTPIKSRKDK